MHLPLSLTTDVSADLDRRLLTREWWTIILNARMDMVLFVDWHGDAAERIGLLYLPNIFSFPDYHSIIRLSWETIRLK